jgi:hypothetical protein
VNEREKRKKCLMTLLKVLSSLTDMAIYIIINMFGGWLLGNKKASFIIA